MVKGISLAAGAAFIGSRAYAQNSSKVPAQAQVINQKSFNVLKTVPPPLGYNASSAVWTPPGYTQESLLAKPFHIYDDEFLAVIGDNPTFSLIGQTPKDPVFHEAVVWYKPTDEVFFAQNVGNPDAGTGLNKSAIIQKISLKEADAVKNERNATGKVKVTVVPTPDVPNPNGMTQYRGQILIAAEGQGDNKPAALIALNPREPYNTTVVLNNFFGRQFNSLNDLTVHPKNLDVYFTDPTYGATQDFRPAPGLQNQVYRFNPKTGAVSVVADGFEMPNGICFSADGKYAYISDSGIWKIGLQLSNPSTIYRYNVADDGTLENRKVFAFIDINIPDGIHTDSKGNLWAGVGDGLQVFNPSGKLIGKIYTGRTAANFQFVGGGRIVIMGETQLYYATVAATGSLVESQL